MSPTGGRRTATRGVFAIEDQALVLPDPIALDTSFVVEALLSTQPLHAVCDDFPTASATVASPSSPATSLPSSLPRRHLRSP